MRRGPMSFKQFLLELPDDVTPEQAQHKYDDYRAEFWGSEVPAIMLLALTRSRSHYAAKDHLQYTSSKILLSHL